MHADKIQTDIRLAADIDNRIESQKAELKNAL